MKAVKALLHAILKKKSTGESVVPEGFCPNCWGKQEYGGQFFEAVKNHHVDINEQNPQIGWIQDYYEKHLQGIQLEPKHEHEVCRNCKLIYRPD